MRFAHLTDIHLPVPARPRLGELVGKRALGYASWLRRRRFWHRLEVSEALARDLRAQGCAAALLSGDIVNISTAAEFAAARAWLDRTFEGLPVVLAPGNHDAYVRTDWARGLGRLGPFLTGRRGGEAARAAAGPDDFPFVFDLAGGFAGVVVANSAPPTAPGLATGRLGGEQIAAIRRELENLAAAGRFAILMLHHPVVAGQVARRKALDDAAPLRRALATSDVGLVLHGHAHAPLFGEIAAALGPAPVIGGGSFSHARAGGAYRFGRYNLFELTRLGDGGFRLDLVIREFDPDLREVRIAETRRFDRRAPAMRKAASHDA